MILGQRWPGVGYAKVKDTVFINLVDIVISSFYAKKKKKKIPRCN